MGAIVELRRGSNKEIALREADPWSRLTASARAEAERRLAVIRPAVEIVAQGCAIIAAASWLRVQLVDPPSLPTLRRWLADYARGGIVALAPQHTGRVRKDYGWEARAQQLYATPTHRCYSTVAILLQQEGFSSALVHRVRDYLKSLPSHTVETSPRRLGAHYYAQNVKPHIVRDVSVLPVGYCYEADGHTCDVYVASPETGNPYRPELTVFIDVRSRYVVGWYLSRAESADTTLFALSYAMVTQGHCPAMVHVDNGSGYRARIMSDETVGFFSRFHIQPLFARPYNSRGKGLIEGWWRWFEERCGKSFSTYCGGDRTDDELKALRGKAESGKIRLPTLAEYADAITAYIHWWNHHVMDVLSEDADRLGLPAGASPADLWATLERVPLETPAAAIVEPIVQRTVRKWGVELDGRRYEHVELKAYEKRIVQVQYSMHRDVTVAIRDEAGRWICDAQLVRRTAALSESRIIDGMQKRLEGQRKRRAIKDAEDAARAAAPITLSDAMSQFAGVLPAPQQTPIELDPLRHATDRYKPRQQPEPMRRPQPSPERLAQVERTAQPIETPQQRYARARALESAEAITATDREWLQIYTGSTEYLSRRRAESME